MWRSGRSPAEELQRRQQVLQERSRPEQLPLFSGALQPQISSEETSEHRRAAETRRTLRQENLYHRGRCSGLGVCGERKQAVSHPGRGAVRPSCCCGHEGLSVRGFGQRAQCSQSGLPDRQPPDPDRTPDGGDGGDGGDRPLSGEENAPHWWTARGKLRLAFLKQ